MQNPKLTVQHFLSLSIVILLFCCTKRNEPLPVSSCKATSKDTSLRIEQKIGITEERFFQTDTLTTTNIPSFFIANDSTADEYSWRFEGSQKVFTGKTIELFFTSTGNYKVTLSQKRYPTNPCYGTLPSETAFTKSFVVVQPSRIPILGTYRGYNQSQPGQPVTIEVLLNGIKNLPYPTTGEYYFQNEIDYGTTAFYIAGKGTYDPDYGAYGTSGYGYLTKNNTKLTIEYSYRKPQTVGFTVIKDTFYGIKQ